MSLRLLFVKEKLSWPRAGGHDVHGSAMMRALADRGHEVWLATHSAATREAVAGLGLAGEIDLSAVPLCEPSTLPPASRLQQRFERYWGQDPRWRRAIATATQRTQFDAVIGLGPDAPLWFRGVRSGLRVWYAADDSALHHWSQVRPTAISSWKNVKFTAIHALYERAFASRIDRSWVVSSADRRAMRACTGRPVDLVPNGVDAEHYRPPTDRTDELPDHLAFWGRLDFGPNEDGIAWFLAEVWPRVRAARPATRLDIFGFRPSERVTTLCQRSDGVTLVPDLPDLRPELVRRPVAVLPFVTGRGIKNKLLEAAALGRAIACTPAALTGTLGEPPVRCERRPGLLAAAIVKLLDDPGERDRLGAAARDWVTRHHSWTAAAEVAEAGLLSHLGPGYSRVSTVASAPEQVPA